MKGNKTEAILEKYMIHINIDIHTEHTILEKWEKIRNMDKKIFNMVEEHTADHRNQIYRIVHDYLTQMQKYGTWSLNKYL